MNAPIHRRSLEAEPPAPMPDAFEAFVLELGLLADCEGAEGLIGAFWFAPDECCRYLAGQPAMWVGLLARGRYADRRSQRRSAG